MYPIFYLLFTTQSSKVPGVLEKLVKKMKYQDYLIVRERSKNLLTKNKYERKRYNGIQC